MLADVIVKVAGMEKEERHEYYPRPSLAGPERCIRQMVYWGSKTPADKETGDRFQLAIDDSTWHEELTADWIRKSAFQLHSEQMEVDTPVGKGHIDGILTDLLEQDYHYEHKALNHFGFIRLWNGDYPFDYITQCCLYQAGLRKINPEISKTILLIKNKNTAQYIEYLIGYDFNNDTATIISIIHSNGQRKDDINFSIPHICLHAQDKFIEVESHIQQKTLPERPFEVGTDYPCSYCSWQNTCWKDYEQEFNVLASEVQLEGEIETLCKYYLETNMHINEMEKEKESLKGKIKVIMEEAQAKQARAGDYAIIRTLRSYKRLDKEKIPLDILKQAETETLTEILTIRKPKKEKVMT